MYQQLTRPEGLFRHVFAEDEGCLVTFSGQQASLRRADARRNELASIRQLSWTYPDEAQQAADYLVDDAQLEREAYFAVHLFREPNTRLASKAAPTVRCLWLDEDQGHFPDDGPEPTAIVHSSAGRRHLYWRLSRPVAIEWAVEMNRRIATWAAGDVGKAGAASVLRAPGTANYKRHPHVDLVGGEFSGVEAWEPEVLDQAAPQIPEPPSASLQPYDGPEISLGAYLERIEIIGEVSDSLGIKYQIICPWVHEHSAGDRSGTRIGQRSNGALWFHCDHEHCQGRTWREFKRAVLWNRRFTIGEDKSDYTGPAITVEVHYE